MELNLENGAEFKENDPCLEEKKNSRQKWSNSRDFIFALLGGSIGLGNVWRFPYLCFKYGGGAFLLPYFLFVLVLGIPMVTMETSIGQKLRLGLWQSWNIIPICNGIAVAQIVVVIYFNVSYAVIMAWTLKYFAASFSSVLPWTTCHNDWNSVDCYSISRQENSTGIGVMSNESSFSVPVNATSSVTEYWMNGVLNVTSSLEQAGSFQIDLTVCLVAVWVLTYLATFKGIKWTAKVVYITATLPFVLIVVILVRGLTLPGADQGLKYYLIPDIGKLIQPEVWVAAGTQVMYSFAIGAGIMTTLGSFNSYNHNFLRDATIFSICNALVSFVSGLAVFSTLGFMAGYQNSSIKDVASSGPGLAFIAYPEALSLLPFPQVWSVLFFLMMIFIGMDSLFISQEAFINFLFDNIRVLNKKKPLCHALAVVLLTVMGLPMMTQGGVYVFEIFNNYGAAGWCMFFMVGCECVAIAWFYGFERYWSEVEEMIGSHRRSKLWLLISWKYIGPVICMTITIYYLVIHKPLTYRGYIYPAWGQAIAHLMSLSSVIFIPGYGIYILVKTWLRRGNIRELFGVKTIDHPEKSASVG